MTPATLEEIEILVAARLAELESRFGHEALTVREVAGRLRLSVTRVGELIRSGELRSYKIDGSRRVDSRDLAAFIDSRRTLPTPIRRTAATTPARSGHGSWLDELRREAYSS
jgi:excisionase family DNA binding protein